jgi:hypothetical protein
MNSFMVDRAAKPVNLLLGSLDESFEWYASIKLRWSLSICSSRADFQYALLRANGCILLIVRAT